MSTPLIARPVIDVSHHNAPANMDWKKAKAYGIVGVIVKVSQGSSYIDPAFQQHLYNADQAGIPLLGGYTFLDDSDPQHQADHFLDLISNEFGGDLRTRLLALDLEGNPAGPTETCAGAAEVSDAIFKRIGRRPVIYVGVYGPAGNGAGLPNATLSLSSLWLPSYSQHPRLPKGFLPPGQEPAKLGGVWRLWQSTDGLANNGQPVPGLGRVDQSAVIGFQDLPSLQQWWGT